MKKNKLTIWFKLVCLIVVLGLLLNGFGFTQVGLAQVLDEPIGKISEKLQQALEEIDGEEMIPIYIWLEDIDYDRVETLAKEMSGYNRASFEFSIGDVFELVEVVLNDGDIIKTEREDGAEVYVDITEEERAEMAENVDAYIEAERAIARQEYSTKHEAFVGTYLEDANIIFISQYAPMIICEISKNTVYQLAEMDQVVSMNLYEEMVFQDQGNFPDVSLPSIKATYARDTLGLNGNGIKVGMIENGRPHNNTNPSVLPYVHGLSASNITRLGANNNVDHATLVAGIIVAKVGSTNYGIVPSAQLYSTTTDNFNANLESLLNYNVTVINMSAGWDNSGTYQDVDQWIDHLIYQHNVCFVQAAGNNQNGYVLSPGLSYNAITVGGIDDMNTVSTSDDTFASFSSYVTASGTASKPDVVAPACNFHIDLKSEVYHRSGTSFAAPHVTGVVAQIQQHYPALKAYPEYAKAVIMRSCDRKVPGETWGSLTNKQGAGVINAQRAVSASGHVGTVLGSQKSKTFNFDITVTNAPTILVLTWFKRNEITSGSHTGTPTNPALTNLDLRVYNSSGALVKASSSTTNNAEYISFTPSYAGTYKVEIYRTTNNTTDERYSLVRYP